MGQYHLMNFQFKVVQATAQFFCIVKTKHHSGGLGSERNPRTVGKSNGYTKEEMGTTLSPQGWA